MKLEKRQAAIASETARAEKCPQRHAKSVILICRTHGSSALYSRLQERLPPGVEKNQMNNRATSLNSRLVALLFTIGNTAPINIPILYHQTMANHVRYRTFHTIQRNSYIVNYFFIVA